MSDLGYDQAMQLRSALMPIAYLLCTLGLLLSVFRNWGNFHEILMSIIGVAVIVILINGYPTTLVTVADAFKQLREQTTANAPGNAQQQNWTKIFDVKFEKPNMYEIAEKIEIAFCQMFKWIGKIAIWLLDWVQAWAFNGLIAISPVLLGMLALPWTQGVGITFLTTSFGVAAWHLGIALVDILLASIATQLFAAVGIGGGVTAAVTISVGLLPIFLGALVAVVIVAIALYLAVPFTIAAVLRGSSPLTAGAKAGMEMTMTALGVATMAGSRFAAKSAAGTLKSGGFQPPSDRESKGGEGGAGGGTVSQSSPHSSSPLLSGGGQVTAARRSNSSAKESGGGSPDQRQSQILAEYNSPGQGRNQPQSQSQEPGQSQDQGRDRTVRLSKNELERRKAESLRVLGERDETYT